MPARDVTADLRSVLRATVMLLSLNGYQLQSEKLTRALNICGIEERKLVIKFYQYLNFIFKI